MNNSEDIANEFEMIVEKAEDFIANNVKTIDDS